MDKTRKDLGKKFQDVLENQEIPARITDHAFEEAKSAFWCKTCGRSHEAHDIVPEGSVTYRPTPRPETTEPTHSSLPVECEDAIKALLRSSWKDIDDKYELLTPTEKACVTEKLHAILVKWIQS